MRLQPLPNTSSSSTLLDPSTPAGKTYLGLKALLEVVSQKDPQTCMFATRNFALCLQVTKWLFERLRKDIGGEAAKKLVEERFRVWSVVCGC